MVPVDLNVIPAVFVVVFFDKLRPGDAKSFLFGFGLLLLDALRATFAVLMIMFSLKTAVSRPGGPLTTCAALFASY